ncbi:hypothetical protein QBC37DRAFT_101580 [Rhypophila decipiens]|uniref:Uncharacterized protein n=1 Tax=Rhypophila decipiens TaxID=261697 RepID=A0AAN7BCS4_9PEZI|nr:hypothetical protein QBC37DRAFT_101580 [Rhypophila decipiens]
MMNTPYYSYAPQQHPTPVHSHHGGRNNRRTGRPATMGQSNQNSQNGAQNLQRLRAGRKDTELSFPVSNFRSKFELTRSFDLEDDMEFCPGLLTESDLVSINSGSERSSLASNSPQSSPTQQPTSVATSFSLNSTSPSFAPSFHHSQSSLKLHQPAATRARNAIPIINPATGITMSSPPQSVSPSRMQQQAMQQRRY